MKPIAAALTILGCLLPALCQAEEIYPDFPASIHPDERYVIYSHGLIAEGVDPKPVSADFGTFDFPAIKQAIFADGGFNLIAHQRPANTEILPYVDLLESWVKALLAAGVSPSRITLVGFSRGSHLSAYAAARLAPYGINTALLASCFDGDINGPSEPLVLGGNLLNIFETSDAVGTCDKLAQRSTLTSFREIAISTGKRHGAFFQPLPEWITPLKTWISETNRPAVLQ